MTPEDKEHAVNVDKQQEENSRQEKLADKEFAYFQEAIEPFASSLLNKVIFDYVVKEVEKIEALESYYRYIVFLVILSLYALTTALLHSCCIYDIIAIFFSCVFHI